MKRIAIVGNAPMEKDCSELVDSCDTVMRFNYCNSFGWGSGVKIDILALANTGGAGRKLCRNRDINRLSIFQKASEIWFAQGSPPLLSQIVDFRNKKDSSRRIVRRLELQDKQLFMVPESTVKATQEVLVAFGAPVGNTPSSGALAIHQVLHTPRFEEMEIALLGFTSKGIPFHSWDAEKKWLADLAEKGSIQMVD